MLGKQLLYTYIHVYTYLNGHGNMGKRHVIVTDSHLGAGESYRGEGGQGRGGTGERGELLLCYPHQLIMIHSYRNEKINYEMRGYSHVHVYRKFSLSKY